MVDVDRFVKPFSNRHKISCRQNENRAAEKISDANKSSNKTQKRLAVCPICGI